MQGWPNQVCRVRNCVPNFIKMLVETRFQQKIEFKKSVRAKSANCTLFTLASAGSELIINLDSSQKILSKKFYNFKLIVNAHLL